MKNFLIKWFAFCATTLLIFCMIMGKVPNELGDPTHILLLFVVICAAIVIGTNEADKW